MKKGLRPHTNGILSMVPSFKTCPDEEGIKTLYKTPSAIGPKHSKLALMKKGLRPMRKVHIAIFPDSKLALMKKGLRQLHVAVLHRIYLFKTCPDEEGIKTVDFGTCWEDCTFKTCPDEEGIKTLAKDSAVFLGRIQNLP